MSKREPQSAHQVRVLSVHSLTSPSTVRRVLEGAPTKGLSRLRVEKAARELGIEIKPRGDGEK